MRAIWNGFIILCGINFLALVALAGVLLGGGLISKQTFYDIVYVFRGSSRAVSQSQLEEYERMRSQNEEYAKLFAEEKGTGEVYRQAADTGAAEVKATREESERVLMQRLAAAAATLADERAKFQDLKAKEQELRDEIIRLRTDAAQKAAALNTEIFNGVMQGMDAEDVSKVLGPMFVGTAPDKAERAIQWLRAWKQKFSSEVLSGMDEGARNVAVTMLEDEFADVPPENIALRWQREKMPLEEMVEHLRTMPVSKALKVIRRLDRNAQDDVWESFAPLQPGS